MTVYIVLINGSVVDWCLLGQKKVPPFVTKSEYSAITEVYSEIIFVHVILLFMGIVAEYTITLHVDNVRAVLISENTAVPQWVNHIDVHRQLIS